MQLLCHWLKEVLPAQALLRLLRGLVLMALSLPFFSSLAQTESPPPVQDKLLAEVGQWVQQSYRLGAEQFSFAPMDARVQLQSCDRPLVIDSPFATRETVRVRCLGTPYWQLYLRLTLKPGVTIGAAPVTPASPASSASTPAKPASAPLVIAPVIAKAPAASAPPALRKVVVGRQLLRAGTALSPEMLEEQEIAAPGVDLQAVVSIKDLEYGEMVRDMQAGVPLRSHDVRRATLVKQGQAVILTIGQSGGFTISARVEAMQDGKMGEQIRLKNPESGRIITGVVTGTGTARGF
jgi:flagella basal body P-ring formation protein FlgA